jgi:DNA mismatch repair protein MutS
MEACGKCTVTEQMTDSIFQPGCFPEIDKLSEEIRECEETRNEALQQLSDVVAKGSNCCKYKDGGITSDGHCWVTFTKPQYAKFNQQFPATGLPIKQYIITKDSMTVDTRNKSNIKIEITLLDQLVHRQESLVSRLRALSIKEFKDLLIKFQTFGRDLDSIANAIGLMDVYQAVATVSRKYGYCRPEICAVSSGESWLNIKQLRHPLVERKNEFVPHDVRLDGMLLYGVNQSGKSCTMKSIGIAVVLAQAGFYVPAKSMEFYPYSNLMTRIIGNDSIDYGLSSYAVEMMELRSILTRANSKTLVLGDEVCHGTESASAVSLVAASLMHLNKSRSSFVFATHLHELSQMPELEHIRQFHITVKFSPDGRIIYDRQIKEGSGTGLYGIEVAKHLRLPTQVLHDAFMIRNKYFFNSQAPATPVPSKYNRDKFVSKCEIRGCENKAEHTHHIRYQCEASADGLIDGHIDVNHKDNLIGLCEKHHEDVHHGSDDKQLVIFSRVQYEYRRLLRSLQCEIQIPTDLK